VSEQTLNEAKTGLRIIKELYQENRQRVRDTSLRIENYQQSGRVSLIYHNQRILVDYLLRHRFLTLLVSRELPDEDLQDFVGKAAMEYQKYGEGLDLPEFHTVIEEHKARASRSKPASPESGMDTPAVTETAG
jgi:hypothetical protein